jgi:predicted transcriptional regulator
LDKAKVLNRVYASSLPSRAKTVMFYLVNRSNKELTCFPAIPTIAKETGLSERTVQRALKELCEEGYIKKTSRYRENGGQSSNLYILIVKEETKHGDSVLMAENFDMKAYKTESKLNDEVDNMQGMRVIDFSYFDKNLFLSDCHRVGDNCVPP